MPRTLTSDDICEELDVDARTLTRWVKRGCPCDKGGRGKPRLFDEAEVAAWMKANNLTGKVGKPAEPMSEQLASAKLRKELALAKKHETAVAKELGKLVAIEDVERSNVLKFTTIRNKLLGLPASAAPGLQGLTAGEIQRVLQDRVEEILTELSRS